MPGKVGAPWWGEEAELGQEGLAEGRGKRRGLPGHVALGQSGPLPELWFPLRVVGLYSGVPGSLPALTYPYGVHTRQKQKRSLTGTVLIYVCKTRPRTPEGWGSGCAAGVPRTGQRAGNPMVLRGCSWAATSLS